eukprot:gene12066-2199_t
MFGRSDFASAAAEAHPDVGEGLFHGVRQVAVDDRKVHVRAAYGAPRAAMWSLTNASRRGSLSTAPTAPATAPASAAHAPGSVLLCGCAVTTAPAPCAPVPTAELELAEMPSASTNYADYLHWMGNQPRATRRQGLVKVLTQEMLQSLEGALAPNSGKLTAAVTHMVYVPGGSQKLEWNTNDNSVCTYDGVRVLLSRDISAD